MKKTKYYAFIVTDGKRTIHFTIHYSKFAAEKHYGDLSRHYKGTANSDYDLTVYTKEELLKSLGKDYLIDFKSKTLTLRDAPIERNEIQVHKAHCTEEGCKYGENDTCPMRKLIDKGWYHSSYHDGSDIAFHEDKPRTSEQEYWDGPFDTFHKCKMDAIKYHTATKDTALNAIKRLKKLRMRSIKR